MTTTSELVSRFADAGDTASRREALIDLIRAKQLHSVVATEPFRLGLARLARSAGDGGDRDRLLAVATLQRAAASAPPIRSTVRTLMKDSVSKPLSSLDQLPDVDDRLYAAKSWRVVPSAWSLDVLATAAAQEESGEAARRECIEGVVELANDVAEAISALRKALSAIRFETKKPGDSLGRRLIRLLGTLTAVLSGIDKPVGENAGQEISQLVDRGFRTVGRPEAPTVRAGVVQQVALLTHAMVRVDFSQGARDKTYEALTVVSEWFAAREWQEICHSSEAISHVSGDLQKSLLVLAEAGKIDENLRRALATAAGSRKNADAICRTMATEHPGIPDDVRDWLAGASRRIQSAVAEESRQRSVDEVLAELLIVMSRLTRAADLVQSDVLSEVSIVLPQQAPALSRMTGLVGAMASKLSLAVRWRSLRLRGTVGQEVEFSPVEHQINTDGTRSRRVRLLSPVVERISEDGVPRVVLKAAVEPIGDRRKQAISSSS